MFVLPVEDPHEEEGKYYRSCFPVEKTIYEISASALVGFVCVFFAFF